MNDGTKEKIEKAKKEFWRITERGRELANSGINKIKKSLEKKKEEKEEKERENNTNKVISKVENRALVNLAKDLYIHKNDLTPTEAKRKAKEFYEEYFKEE